MTRSVPVAGPLGSFAGSSVYGAYQSAVHSQTLPARSRTPLAEAPAGNEPTVAVAGKWSSSSYIVLRVSLLASPQVLHSLPQALRNFPLGSSSPQGYLR